MDSGILGRKTDLTAGEHIEQGHPIKKRSRARNYIALNKIMVSGKFIKNKDKSCPIGKNIPI